jgi:hypothetical protein
VIYTLPDSIPILKGTTQKFYSGVSTDNGLQVSQTYYKGNVVTLASKELDSQPVYLTVLQTGIAPTSSTNIDACNSKARYMAHYDAKCMAIGKTSTGNDIIRFDHTSQDESDRSLDKPSGTFSSDINDTRVSFEFWTSETPANVDVVKLFSNLQKTDYKPDSFYPSQISPRYIP